MQVSHELKRDLLTFLKNSVTFSAKAKSISKLQI